jgi:hypothetical protein
MAPMALYTHKRWNVYECSDCLDGKERDDDDDIMAEGKWLLALPEGTERPDYCPMCASYLSLGDPTLVEITRVKE